MQLFFNSECAWKTMNERLIIGGMKMNGEIKRFFVISFLCIFTNKDFLINQIKIDHKITTKE